MEVVVCLMLLRRDGGRREGSWLEEGLVSIILVGVLDGRAFDPFLTEAATTSSCLTVSSSSSFAESDPSSLSSSAFRSLPSSPSLSLLFSASSSSRS